VPRVDDIARIRAALEAAAEAIRPFTPGDIAFELKAERGDPLTEADLAADEVLRAMLPQAGEGWLSEESVDDSSRLRCRRVWVVDPIDGTREFIDGVPEWSISIGLLEDGLPVAGGILNPETDQLVIGSLESGVEYNGAPARVLDPVEGKGADGSLPVFNQARPRFPNFVAAGVRTRAWLVEHRLNLGTA